MDAKWFIDDRRQPELKATTRPFRPRPQPGMEQVRVEAKYGVSGKFEYLFDRGRHNWLPVFAPDGELALPQDAREMLMPLELIPPEDQPWQRVQGLVPEESDYGPAYSQALIETSPESGAFVLFSLRRRSDRSRKGDTQKKWKKPR